MGLLLDQSIEDNIVFNAMQIKGEYLYKLGPMTLKNSKAIRAQAEKMIKEFIKKVLGFRLFKPNIVVCIPSIITEVDRTKRIGIYGNCHSRFR